MCYIQDTMVRVRFAPSPTGYLHIGALRTCLFNWLFARHHKGEFILRIEDTDLARSSEEMTRIIIDGLRWLGLDWDEGPLFQSERTSLYKTKAEELVRVQKAYYCYCLPEEIQQRKKGKEKSWMYDRRCLRLQAEDKDRFESEGRPKAIRFYVPCGETAYRDLIHGPISIQNRILDDFVIFRSDGLPTYHLSVVVDDSEWGITHVIRGDDHISNTPKQILLYQAFGFHLPEFAHLALILGPDRKKLSKRHGVTSVLQFREQGYFPLSLLNFLAQMSWDPGEGERIYSLSEMADKFSVERVSKNSPVFDLAKLQWFNGQMISRMSAPELAPYVKAELEEKDLWIEELEKEKRDWFYRFIDLLKDRSRVFRDFSLRGKPFLSENFEYDPSAVEKYLQDERLPVLMAKLKEDFQKMDSFFARDIEKVLRNRAAEEGVEAALLIHASRVLVLGMAVSPSIFDVLELIGREKTVERLGRLEELL
jgi:glutamyl-tRNA synthetase/nondiscriminating glutamyl-tRNA synthetase